MSFKCFRCEENFWNQDEMEYHLLNDHNTIVTEPHPSYHFYCPVPGCDQFRATAKGFYSHFINDHNGQIIKPNGEELPTFRCEATGCNNLFFSASSLYRHRRAQHRETINPCVRRRPPLSGGISRISSSKQRASRPQRKSNSQIQRRIAKSPRRQGRRGNFQAYQRSEVQDRPECLGGPSTEKFHQDFVHDQEEGLTLQKTNSVIENQGSVWQQLLETTKKSSLTGGKENRREGLDGFLAEHGTNRYR